MQKTHLTLRIAASAVMIAATFAALLFGFQAVRADDSSQAAAKTYLIQEGAFPWYDRVGNWSLTKVPDSLKGSGPVAQQSCSSRSLDIDGKPKSVLIAVSNGDVPTFKTKVPDAKQTADTIAVKNAGGTVIDYTIFELANPPARIDGAGVYGAGLMLLKSTPAVAKPAK